jgi:ABC-type iron transport system FetAB ATPase subunit
LEAEPLLRLEKLELAFGESKAALFSSLDVELHADHAYVLGGPSGVGKSTLLRCLAGLEARAQGRLCWRGHEVVGKNMPAFRKGAIYVPQAPPRMPLSVQESLEAAFAFRSQSGEYDSEAVLDLCGKLLLDEELLTHRLADLSGGEAQRFGLVRALVLGPSVLLLDEPASSLDSEARDRLASVLREWLSTSGRALVVCSHEPSWCEDLVTDYWTLSAGSKLDRKAKQA